MIYRDMDHWAHAKTGIFPTENKVRIQQLKVKRTEFYTLSYRTFPLKRK